VSVLGTAEMAWQVRMLAWSLLQLPLLDADNVTGRLSARGDRHHSAVSSCARFISITALPPGIGPVGSRQAGGMVPFRGRMVGGQGHLRSHRAGPQSSLQGAVWRSHRRGTAIPGALLRSGIPTGVIY
jgi:hypothetical protein